MEILTVKNNKIDYLTLKKVVFYTFPTYYILSLVAMFCGALIALFINLYTGDIIEIATCIIILLIVATAPLIQSRMTAKKYINQLNDLYHTDVIFYDLVFDESKLTSTEYSSKNEIPMKYKNIKKILETKDVVIFTSKAEYTIYFEKKKASNEDIKRLHAFFDKQNITWRKSIL